MSGLYDTKYTLDVGEDENGMFSDDAVDMTTEYRGDYVLDEVDVDQFVVNEDVSDMIPGSESKYVDDDGREERPKTWADDKNTSDFINYAKDQMTKVPRHSGETVHGCERAKAFLKKLRNELSHAMRLDLESNIDEQEAEELSKNLDDGIERLNKQIKKLTGKRAQVSVRLVSDGHCDKCDSHAPMWNDVNNNRFVCMSCSNTSDGDEIVKEANTPVLNVYVSAFERAIVGTLINSTVSAGRNIAETYDKLKKKYAFTDREELAIQQLVADHGYPIIKDRGLMGEKEDVGNTVDFQSNYHA